MRFLAAIPAFAAILLIAAAAPTTIPADDPRVMAVGRSRRPGDGSLRLTWLGAGVRVAHSGTYLRGTFALTAGVGSGHAKVREPLVEWRGRERE